MRLQQFVPPLDPSFVQALSEIGIKTDTDLLLTHDPLATFTKLPARHGVTLKQYREVLAQVAGLAAATPTYGDKLLERETKRQEDIFSDVPDTMQLGVPAVDALVGGFAPPRVIEVSGDSGTGKTVRVCASDRCEADVCAILQALALQLALRHLTQVATSIVHWIDSSGEFSPERVSNLLEHFQGPVR